MWDGICSLCLSVYSVWELSWKSAGCGLKNQNDKLKEEKVELRRTADNSLRFVPMGETFNIIFDLLYCKDTVSAALIVDKFTILQNQLCQALCGKLKSMFAPPMSNL